MIVRSIRLKNIKSFGEGATGDGVTIRFAPGINRIAGRNGHGKSTLIESLGYALFLADPLAEESFKVTTYLLRAGKSVGEIDVTFTHDGDTFRLERGLGLQNKRRAKVVQLSDDSIAAEGDAEVEAFLCRIAGVADGLQLAELFTKLVGVKQGRLTLPFDAKPGEARSHFEPLMEVEIFRRCFESLRPVVGEFAQMRSAEGTRLAIIVERIRERAESPEKAEAAAQLVEALAAKMKAAEEIKNAATAAVTAHEKRQTVVRDAERLRQETAGQHDLAKHRHDTAVQRLNEAVAAAATLAQAQPAHDAYAVAEKAGQELQDRQQRRAKLRDEQAALQRSLARCEEQAASAQRRARELAEEAKAKAAELERQKLSWDETQKALQADRSADQEMAAMQRVDLLGQRCAAAEQQRQTLTAQLAQISGGVCPLLKETCRQFDAAKVQADLGEFAQALPPLQQELEIARKDAQGWQKAARETTARRAHWEAEAKAIEARGREMVELGEHSLRELALVDQRQKEGAELKFGIEKIQGNVSALGDLDAELRRVREVLESNAAGHRAYLAARSLAGELAVRETQLAEGRVAWESLVKKLAETEAAFATARQNFDSTALAIARRDLQDASAVLATHTANLANAKKEHCHQEQRVREREAALLERAALDLEIARLNAAIALTEKARTVLKNAAPSVAQHLCNRLAAQAQQLFNRIHPEPAELEWNSERYSLRIHPGERRFAMLSGGEQTKLALAMTLAMIQDFSRLKFCVFDEPTYGVDTDSRDLLASAIVEVQAAAVFDQLLLVSHDDAFDGKIEHVVLLKKTAAGTVVEER
jgi:DNA repair exonuclease SbcCD ATPase subunit